MKIKIISLFFYGLLFSNIMLYAIDKKVVFQDGYSTLNDDNSSLKALFDTKQNRLTAYKYSRIKYLDKGLYLFEVLSNAEEYIIGYQDNVKSMPLYYATIYCNQGILNAKGKEIVPIIQENNITGEKISQKVELFFWGNEKKLRVISSSRKEAIYNLDGQVFIPFKEYYFGTSNKKSSIPYIRILKKDSIGYLDLYGREIPFSEPYVTYHFGYFFSNESSSESNHGVFDGKGKVVIPSIYKSVYLKDKKIFVAVDKRNELSYFDLKGEKIGKFGLNLNYYMLDGSLSNNGFCVVYKKEEKYSRDRTYYLFSVYSGKYEIIESSVKGSYLRVGGFKTLGDSFSVRENGIVSFYRVIFDDKSDEIKLEKAKILKE